MSDVNLIEIAKKYEKNDEPGKAYQYYLEAALADDDKDAVYALANMYMLGDYVGEDFEKAAHYFEIAYERGYDLSPELFIFIGSGYENGDRYREKMPEAARKWYQMAAEAGVDYAYACLGKLLYEGDCGEQDYQKAYECFIKAGEKESMTLYYLGLMYENGQYVKKNSQKAKEYYEKIVNENPDLKSYGDLHYGLAEQRLGNLRNER